MRNKKKQVIPMFGLSLGITVTMLSLIVLLPMAALAVRTGNLSWQEFINTIFSKRVLAAFRVSMGTAFVAAMINTVMGLILAWVLTRYRFPFRRLMDGMIELPFALPTAVAGMTLTSLTSDTGLIGSFFAQFGIRIAYTRIGIAVALIFSGIPFVVRSVQPVLEKLDPVYEEAASLMGAGNVRIFARVIFPEILPALLVGFGLAFGRGIGEYGSVVFIAGNKPYETEIIPLLIMSKLEAFDYNSACAIALVLLVLSFAVFFAVNLVSTKLNKQIR